MYMVDPYMTDLTDLSNHPRSKWSIMRGVYLIDLTDLPNHLIYRSDVKHTSQ